MSDTMESKIFRVKLSGTVFAQAASEEEAIELAAENVSLEDMDFSATLASEPDQKKDEFTISRQWLRQVHEKAIHEFNNAPSDAPTFRTGYWNGYAMAIKAILQQGDSSRQVSD